MKAKYKIFKRKCHHFFLTMPWKSQQQQYY